MLIIGLAVAALCFAAAGVVAINDLMRAPDPPPRYSFDDVIPAGRRVSNLEGAAAAVQSDSRLASTMGFIPRLRDTVNRIGMGAVDEARSGRLSARLERADLTIKPGEWVAAVLAAMAVMAALLVLRFHSPYGLLPAPVVVVVGSEGVIRFLISRRRRRLDKQIPYFMTSLSGALKAGGTIGVALTTAAKTQQPPLKKELEGMVREMEIANVPLDAALENLVHRNDSEEIELMAQAIQINRTTGGNLAEVLDNIATIVRERIRIEGAIRTLTAQARVSGAIITVLPLALAGILSVISPDYFLPMFHQQLGIVMLAAGGISMLIGDFFIMKIARIDV